MKTFNLVNNDLEKSKYKELAYIQRDELGKKFLVVYADDDYFIFYRISKGLINNTENQTELPISALHWISKKITEGFWKKPSEGGFDRYKHADSATFDGEEIMVSRTMNASYGEPGFKIVNKARNSYIITTKSQEMQLTDACLKEILLPIFDKYEG